ncbi:hypothetical protein OSTOST_16085, partial [Ostertagia ostertagi]
MWAIFPGAIALLGSVFLLFIRNRTKKAVSRPPNVSIEKQSIPVKDEPGVYKSGLLPSDDQLVIENMYPGLNTLYDLFCKGLKESRDGPCLGTRGSDGQYRFQRYSEVLKDASNFASAAIGELEMKA